MLPKYFTVQYKTFNKYVLSWAKPLHVYSRPIYMIEVELGLGFTRSFYHWKDFETGSQPEDPFENLGASSS